MFVVREINFIKHKEKLNEMPEYCSDSNFPAFTGGWLLVAGSWSLVPGLRDCRKPVTRTVSDPKIIDSKKMLIRFSIRNQKNQRMSLR